MPKRQYIKYKSIPEIQEVVRKINSGDTTDVLVEFPNTKGLSSNDILNIPTGTKIRIAGAYDDERIEIYKDKVFGRTKDSKTNETAMDYYFESVVYTRNELYRILQEIEKIESGISDNWSDIQKLVYIYDYLKRGITYDPKYQNQPSSEVRTLRGLVTKKTVCAGYSLILKEILDRQGIKCEFIRGNSHAWNIVTIEGENYPIDLTWENAMYRTGDFETMTFMGQNIDKFNQSHKPDDLEPKKNLHNHLSTLNPELLKRISKDLRAKRTYEHSTYEFVENGKKISVIQIGSATVNDEKVYRYYYLEKGNDIDRPLILYSESNLQSYINNRNFRILGEQEKAEHFKKLFSKENIEDALQKKTFYIGKITETNANNKVKEKNEPQTLLFKYPTMICKWNNGKQFILQKMSYKPTKIGDSEVYCYHVISDIRVGNLNTVQRLEIYSETDFTKQLTDNMINGMLSESRLMKKAQNAGGYIGYIKDGQIAYNTRISEYFKTSNRVEIEDYNKGLYIPSFEQLKHLTEKYETVMEYFDVNTVKVVERKTSKVVQNPNTTSLGIFATIWKTAASTTIYTDEEIRGLRSAFNNKAKRLYEWLIPRLIKSINEVGYIDTVSIFEEMLESDNTTFDLTAIIKMFRTEYQSELINEIFSTVLNVPLRKKKTQPLYNELYAISLTENKNDNSQKHFAV